MKYNYEFTTKTERTIIATIRKYSAALTPAVKDHALQLATDAIKAGFDHAAKLEKCPPSVPAAVELAIALAIKADIRSAARVLTPGEKTVLINIVQAPYHSSGKIAGMQSIDSNSECGFCQSMRAIQDQRCICKYCYAHKECMYKTYVQQRHEITAFILSQFEFTVDDLRGITLYTPIVRFNSDGDVINAVQAANYHKIALANPGIKFGFWFKNVAPVAAAVQQFGKLENIAYIYSDPYIDGSDNINAIKARFPFIDYTFTVYHDKKTTLAAINAGAACCNGRNCSECGYKCYYKAHTENNIAECARGIKA